jgi:hypothetical protein
MLIARIFERPYKTGSREYADAEARENAALIAAYGGNLLQRA